MNFNLWFVIVGALLIVMALSTTKLSRLPLSTAMLYLALGMILSPMGLGLFHVNAVEHSAFLERATEVVVIIALFSAGLKLRVPLRSERWRLPARLALLSMSITVALIALVGVLLLQLPLGAAILLGAVLAPTDPVLASDVQVRDPEDRDRLRFSLTGEAGLNDGTAFPFVMLGLGLLGLHELGEWGIRWLVVDVLWATTAGLAVGWLLGTGIGHLILYLRREYKESVGTDDFLALGLIALSYGLALMLHSYGFLAVFAAGLALRRVERLNSEKNAPKKVEAAALIGEEHENQTDPDHAPAYMAQAVLGFSEQLERIGTVAVVLILGAMVATQPLNPRAFVFAALLFLVIRPISVIIGLARSRTSVTQRRFIAWFGVRGVGSLYYLTYAFQHGVPSIMAQYLATITLIVIAISVLVHGISVTPFMKYYQRSIDEGSPAA